MLESQEHYFALWGGDEYFRRNVAVQDAARPYHMSEELLAGLRGELPSKGRAAVLGGAGGRSAAALKEQFPSWTVSNVDISHEAIEFGRRTFPQVEHHCLSISSVEPRLSDVLGELDVILVTGVLLWVDRAVLSRAIANIDESLLDGGILLISDFLPPTRRKNPIKHAPQYFTYKQDYSQPFLSLGTYEAVTISSYVVAEPKDIDEHERRRATCLLKKNLTGLYPVGLPPGDLLPPNAN